MPVKSSSSSVLRWPETGAVQRALERWARARAEEHAEILRVGYFGSYARGDAGVGSDIDVVMVVAAATQPWERRAARWDTTSLPVPADLLIYTAAEWQAIDWTSRFGRVLSEETRWLFRREPA